MVHNANGTDGSNLGPVSVTGAPFSCAALAQGSAAGGGLVQAFPFVHLETVGDVAVSTQLFASGTVPPTPCSGDCDGSGTVTVDELITMVNIALGNSPVSACAAGDANGDGQITITQIIAAVNNALNGCA